MQTRTNRLLLFTFLCLLMFVLLIIFLRPLLLLLLLLSLLLLLQCMSMFAWFIGSKTIAASCLAPGTSEASPK